MELISSLMISLLLMKRGRQSSRSLRRKEVTDRSRGKTFLLLTCMRSYIYIQTQSWSQKFPLDSNKTNKYNFMRLCMYLPLAPVAMSATFWNASRKAPITTMVVLNQKKNTTRKLAESIKYTRSSLLLIGVWQMCRGWETQYSPGDKVY